MNAKSYETRRTGFRKLLRGWLGAPVTELIHGSSQVAKAITPRRRVLIVDDDAVVRLVTSKVLREMGYEVTAAADCSEAIGAVGQGRPDVILLDLNFPPDLPFGGGVNWDGLRLMNWLKQLRNSRGSRFIIITSSDSAESKEAALAAGVAGFLRKPIDHNKLLELLDQELNSGPEAKVPSPRFQFEI